MNQAMILSLLRYALVSAGTYVVAKGYLSETAWNEIVGGLMMIVPAAWGAWKHRSGQ